MSKTTEQFIAESRAIHGDKYDYSLVVYNKGTDRIKIICPDHGEFEQIAKNHTRGRGCKPCGITKMGKGHKKTTEKFIEDARSVHDNTYDYSLVDYNHVNQKVRIICKTHGEFLQTPMAHLLGHGCHPCGLNKMGDAHRKETDKFIKESIVIHGDKYDYSLVEYKHVHQKVKIICKKHGEFKQSPTHHLRGSGCAKCKTSKGERAIETFLIESEIVFETQKTFDGCKNIRSLSFDFYIDKIKLLIEFDGIQHYEPVAIWGGNEGLVKRQMKDGIKNKYAKENGYYLVRIRDENDIESLLKLYIDLYYLDSTKYIVYNNELFYDDLEE